MIEYYELTDRKHKGMLIKKDLEIRDEFYYNLDKRGWMPIGIMIRYYWPDSSTFEMYRIITEEEVLCLIESREKDADEMFW